MSTSNRFLKVFAGSLTAGSLILLTACGGISPSTKERVAQTEMAVQQAQTTLGTSENGAIELQRAREALATAKRAMENGKEGEALRGANEAQLSAELAVAKSQSATARKAAEDMLASIETLRKEATRGQPQR
jgi:acetylglutamate kinase